MISVYVHDFLLMLNSLKNLLWLKDAMKNKYDMKDLGAI